MFCLGSPLAVFLALRGFRPQGKGTLDHIMPSSLCKRLFNIYHPYDPVVRMFLLMILKIPRIEYICLVQDRSSRVEKMLNRNFKICYSSVTCNSCRGCDVFLSSVFSNLNFVYSLLVALHIYLLHCIFKM